MRSRVLLLLLAAAFAAGVLYLFGAQYAGGEVYPEYSSLRADPMGAKLLFDGLSQLPGTVAERNYLPLDFMAGNAATVILLNLDPEMFANEPQPYLDTIEKLARRGNRVVAALRDDAQLKMERTGALNRLWHVRFGVDADKRRAHNLFFAEAPGWAVVDRIGPKLFAIERSFGKGSVVLFSGSGDFSNESTVAADRLTLVSAAIGTNTRVMFDEAHLGIAESGSVVALARRFHLTGFAIGLAVWAALFIWKNASTGAPAAPEQNNAFAGRTSAAGLLTLLRRHIPPGEITQACWREWLTANRREVSPDRLARAEGISRQLAGRPLDAMREIEAVLHTKGPL